MNITRSSPMSIAHYHQGKDGADGGTISIQEVVIAQDQNERVAAPKDNKSLHVGCLKG